jgi:hypothetical protein
MTAKRSRARDCGVAEQHDLVQRLGHHQPIEM